MAITMAIEALQSAIGQTDLISRQAALAEFVDGRDVYDIMERIESLPSADRPEPGRWKIVPDTDEYGLKRPKLVCSKCEKEPAAWDSTELFDYCPNCGTKMRGDIDEE